MLTIRDANNNEFEHVMKIYKYAQDFMIASGNPTQWGHFYPTEELITQDINGRACKVVCDRDTIHGVFALFEGEESTYAHIEDGNWLNDAPYATIHRIASDGQAHGVFQCAVNYCKDYFSNIRIDTHADNKIMQRLIEKSGFTKCGTIIFEDGTPRIAYQWCEK